MKRHSKDWYFAAASANDVWATAHESFTAERQTGAPIGSCMTLYCKMIGEVFTKKDEVDKVDQAYLTVQYGLEKAGLICKERRKKGKS